MSQESTEKAEKSLDHIKNSPIKQEIDLECSANKLPDVMVQIKSEAHISDLMTDSENLNLDLKEEALIEYDHEVATQSEDKFYPKSSVSVEVEFQNSNEVLTKTEEGYEHSDDEIKEEMIMGDDLVSYDYPNFDDAGSIDSNEVSVLGNVETCMGEDYIKSESPTDFEDQIENEYDVKKEPGIVTETHLITKKVINTTSTITNPQDGLIESQTTKTLVMEILPMEGSLELSKLGNPEEILPTTTYNSGMEYGDMFQLNSITGNVLTLEQEAYGLLKAKKNVKSSKTFNCDKCSKECKNSSGLRNHMAVHRTIERRAMGVIKGLKTRKENQKKRYKEEQEYSPNQSLNVEQIEVEVKREVKTDSGYTCTCGQVFKRRSRMETCIRSHNQSTFNYLWHQCVTCLKQYKNKEELIMHRKKAHRKKFQCKFCPTDYNTRKELFKHLQIHQKVQLMEYKVISEVMKGKQKLRCFMCNESYLELSELKSHVMDDHKSPYICPNCKMTFPKIIEFGNHVKTYHPEVEGQSVLDVLEAFSKLVKAWKCEECGLQLHDADKLALHQMEKHNPDLKADPQFQCIDCRRVFISQKGLTSHRRIHHCDNVEEADTTEKGIMCLECRKICKDMDALTSHMRFHSPDRKYPCKFCDFRFATPEKRKSHAEIHTGDMKYVCFICEYQCSSENRLSQHKMSLKHLNMKEFLLTGKPLIEEERSTSKPKAKRKKEDKKIEEDGHSASDNNVPCDICGESFASEEIMQEHKQTHPFIEFPNDDKPSRIFFK